MGRYPGQRPRGGDQRRLKSPSRLDVVARPDDPHGDVSVPVGEIVPDRLDKAVLSELPARKRVGQRAMVVDASAKRRVPRCDCRRERHELQRRLRTFALRVVLVAPEIDHGIGGEPQTGDSRDERGDCRERRPLRAALREIGAERVVEPACGCGCARRLVNRRVEAGLATIAAAERELHCCFEVAGACRIGVIERTAQGCCCAARPDKQADPEADGAAECDVLDAHEPDVPAAWLEDVEQDDERDREPRLTSRERDACRRKPGEQDRDRQQHPEHCRVRPDQRQKPGPNREADRRPSQSAQDVLAGVERTRAEDGQRPEHDPERVLNARLGRDADRDPECEGGSDAVAEPDGAPTDVPRRPFLRCREWAAEAVRLAAEDPVDEAAAVGAGCQLDVRGDLRHGERQLLGAKTGIERRDQRGGGAVLRREQRRRALELGESLPQALAAGTQRLWVAGDAFKCRTRLVEQVGGSGLHGADPRIDRRSGKMRRRRDDDRVEPPDLVDEPHDGARRGAQPGRPIRGREELRAQARDGFVRGFDRGRQLRARLPEQLRRLGTEPFGERSTGTGGEPAKRIACRGRPEQRDRGERRRSGKAPACNPVGDR